MEWAVGVGIGCNGVLVIEDCRRVTANLGCCFVATAAIGRLRDKEVGLQARGQLISCWGERERKCAIEGIPFAVKCLCWITERKLAERGEVNQALAWPGLAAIKRGIET